MTDVVIVGAGSWGTALAVQLGARDIPVTLLARNPERAWFMGKTRENPWYLPGIKLPGSVEVTADPAVTEKASALVLAVPAQTVRKTLRELPAGQPARILINTAKGLELDSLKRLTVVMEEECPGDRICVLSGPSHAEEVARFLPTAVVAASDDPDTARQVQELFMSDSLRVYSGGDLTGVEIGGAVKNVIALAAGINAGLGFGDNSSAALVTRGLHEISKLGQALGASRETFGGLTGLGDLVVTCGSLHSRNRTCGYRLGRGEKLEDILADMGMVVEGVATARAARRLAESIPVDMPITREVCRVLFEDKSPRESVLDLMTRDMKEEMRL